MQKSLKITLIFTIALFLSTFTPAEAQYNGCWPDPATSTTFMNCPDGGWVIRCDCGSGYCQPGSQELCDDDPQQ